MPPQPPATVRYAVSFAPHPGSPWWLAGSHWLGRCAALLQPLAQLSIDGVSPTVLAHCTAEPRRHGWQAPLLPAFALAPEADWITLHGAVQSLARSLTPFAMPPMTVQALPGGLALVPVASHAALPRIDAVVAACATGLSALAHLPQAPAPRPFHLALTGPLGALDVPTQTLLQEAADDLFGILPPARFDSLAVFCEPAPGADLMLLDHLEMGPD